MRHLEAPLSAEEHQPDVVSEGDPRLDRMLDLLESMDARLSRLESQVAQLSGAGPAASGAVSDTIHSAVSQAAERGVDVEARVQASLGLLEVLTEPATVEVLRRLVQRIDLIDQGLVVLQQLPDLAEGAVDTVNRVVTAASETGLDLNIRAQTSVALLERLTEPATVEALLRLLDHAEEAATVAEAVAQLPGLAGSASDTINGVIGQLKDSGIDLEARVRGLVLIAGDLTRPRTLAAIGQLLEQPESLERLASIVEAPTQVATSTPVGALGALGALFDPNVQRSLGFAIEVARTYGKQLDAAD